MKTKVFPEVSGNSQIDDECHSDKAGVVNLPPRLLMTSIKHRDLVRLLGKKAAWERTPESNGTSIAYLSDRSSQSIAVSKSRSRLRYE